MGHVLTIPSFTFQRRNRVRPDNVEKTVTAPTPEVDRVHSESLSLEDIYRAHFTDVWHAVRRLGGREADLEDLAQEVFMTFWRTRERFDRSRALKPWLYGIAFRVVSDYRRKASFSREIPASQNEPLVGGGGALPDEVYATRQRQALVGRALESLGEEQRAVFVMVDIEGYSVVEVSESLGIKLNTTYSRLRLARKKFTEAAKRLNSQRQTSAPRRNS